MSSSATVLSFFRVRKGASDWSQQELSEFYRVESALLQGGVMVATDRGLSDEGDPWFVFCREDDGEVIAHFARIDHQYVVVSSAFSGVARGRDFRILVAELINARPQMLPSRSSQTQNVFMHPASLLVALVATAFLMSSEKSMADHQTSEIAEKGAIRAFSLSDFAVLSAVAIAATWIESQLESAFKLVLNAHDIPPLQLDPGSGGHSADHTIVAVDPGSSGIVFPFFHWEDAHHILDILAGGWEESTNLLQADEVSRGGTAGTTNTVVPQGSIASVGNLVDHNQDTNAAIQFSDPLTLGAGGSLPNTGDAFQAALSNLTAQPISTTSSFDISYSSDSTLSASSSIEAVRIAASDMGDIGLAQFVVGLPVAGQSVGQVIDAAMSHAGYSASTISMTEKLSAPDQASTGSDQTATTTSHPTGTSVAPTAGDATVTNGTPTAGDPTVTNGAPGATPFIELHGSFDAVANSLFITFLESTQHFEVDMFGKNIVVIDTNLSDSTHSNFGMQVWSMADGSTLTIVGIIPQAAHAVS
jgi:hypothetical protein